MLDKYNVVRTEEQLKSLDKILMKGDTPRYDFLAYDTEANGLKLYESVVVGFSLSFDKYSGYYVPLLQWVPDTSVEKKRTIKGEKYDTFPNGNLKCIWTGEEFDEFVTVDEYDLKNRVPLIPALLNRWLNSGTRNFMWNAPYDVNMTDICFGVSLEDSLFLDGSLLVHVLDENHPVALKANLERFRNHLNINPYAIAALEKKELVDSIIHNGGDKAGQVWRASLEPQAKYACADTFFTYGICKAAMDQFAKSYGKRGLQWFFNTEVMPLCKEVVCEMKRRGVYINVEHFEKLHEQNESKLNSLQDEIMDTLGEQNLLDGFDVGKSVDEEVSNRALVRRIMERESVTVPTKVDKKTGEEKESFAKAVVKKYYEENPHWIYGYLLGEDEIKYDEDELSALKLDLYQEKTGKRYHFNIGSSAHLAWLFCDKLGHAKDSLPQTDSATKENPIPQMGAEVLEEYFLKDYPWVAKLLSWKKLSKLQSTYVTPALKLHRDGWLYMEMKQNGTTSGRFSCSGGYNLQTLPRVDDEVDLLNSCAKCHSSNVEVESDIECMANCVCKDCGHVTYDISRPSAIKAGFIAPPGYKIVNADYSSLEPRCFAEVSGEEGLKDVYRKGLDLYSKVYCDVFDKENQYSAHPDDENFLKKVNKNLRQFIKPVVLAIPYGAEAGQVAILTDSWIETKNENGEVERRPDFAKGQSVIDQYLGGLPSLAKYMRDMEEKAMTQGFVETLVGRRRHLNDVNAIAKILAKYHVDANDLRRAPKNKLKERECSFVAFESKNPVYLSEDALGDIRKELGITRQKLEESGNWNLIRYLLKSDLNNAKNAPIQSLAAHITNLGMLYAQREFKKRGLDAWVALQVHDEIMTYAREDQAEEAAEVLKESMETHEYTKLLSIPMVAEPIVCDNLKDAK